MNLPAGRSNHDNVTLLITIVDRTQGNYGGCFELYRQVVLTLDADLRRPPENLVDFSCGSSNNDQMTLIAGAEMPGDRYRMGNSRQSSRRAPFNWREFAIGDVGGCTVGDHNNFVLSNQY